MGKQLVIVESPAKAKTIGRFLGEGYVVRASLGHIRDLPKKEFAVDVENDFKPTYVLLSGRRKIISALRKVAKEADVIYLATDLDREGEAIAWHLVEALRIPKKKVKRVTFNEITRSAVSRAFAEPGELSVDKFNAQQARRILDRIVGYKLSPLLWEKFRRGLSAGRVQSVAVRLIVDREREIDDFKQEEFWIIRCLLHPRGRKKEKFRATLKQREGQDWKPGSQKEANAVSRKLKSAAMKVRTFEAQEVMGYPFPPLITSTMQQSAWYELKFPTKKTMLIAQQLYEGVDLGEQGRRGLISYHRTDSIQVSWAAIGMVRKYIKEHYSKKYLPARPRVRKARPGAQAAHEAIRPTSMKYELKKIKKHLSEDQFNLYELIWKRFVASQMTPAVYSERVVEVEAGKYLLEGKSRTLKFGGHSKVSGIVRDIVEPVLPEMEAGDKVVFADIEKEQQFTRPPARYTEGSLVKVLEKEGIGRPSTYAAIISTIQGRKYVEKRRATLHPTDIGKMVTGKLVEFFPRIMDVKFTSAVEEKLDQIEEAKADWHEVLKDFYDTFMPHLRDAEEKMSPNNPAEETGKVCEKCGQPMIVRFKGKDAFLGCSGYPECRNTTPVSGPREKKPVIETDIKCDKCGAPMVIREGPYGKFIACSAFPKCRNTRPVDEAQPGAKGKKAKAKPSGEKCEKCGKEMILRKGRWGKFLACSGYPECSNTRSVKAGGDDSKTEKQAAQRKKSSTRKKKAGGKPSGETCEKCGKEMVWRKGKWGKFLACSGYPECRNIRKDAKPPGKSRS